MPEHRFDAARTCIEDRAELLGGEFEFDFWDARACYFHDPAENIVELIAHRGIEVTLTGLDRRDDVHLLGTPPKVRV